MLIFITSMYDDTYIYVYIYMYICVWIYIHIYKHFVYVYLISKSMALYIYHSVIINALQLYTLPENNTYSNMYNYKYL